MLRGFSDASSVDEPSERVLAFARSGAFGTREYQVDTGSNSMSAPIDAYARTSRCTVSVELDQILKDQPTPTISPRLHK
jgi:hypothetical protein